MRSICALTHQTVRPFRTGPHFAFGPNCSHPSEILVPRPWLDPHPSDLLAAYAEPPGPARRLHGPVMLTTRHTADTGPLRLRGVWQSCGRRKERRHRGELGSAGNTYEGGQSRGWANGAIGIQALARTPSDKVLSTAASSAHMMRNATVSIAKSALACRIGRGEVRISPENEVDQTPFAWTLPIQTRMDRGTPSARANWA